MSGLSGKELAQELERFVNYSGNEEEFVNGFLSMHRTLQQKTFALMMKCVQAMADMKYTDARNRASHKQAKLMIKGYKKEMIKALIAEQPDYWTEEKAREHVNGDYFKISSLPLI